MTNGIIQSLICLQLQQKKKIKHVQESDENKSFSLVFRTFFGNIRIQNIYLCEVSLILNKQFFVGTIKNKSNKSNKDYC